MEKKYLVQTKVEDELFTEVMTEAQLIRQLEIDAVADYITALWVFDVTEPGQAIPVNVGDIWQAPVLSIAGISDSDYYASKEG